VLASDFSVEVDAFVAAYQKHSQVARFEFPEVRFTFARLLQGFHGECRKLDDGTVQVAIQESAWENLSPNRRELVIFHELGHCVLGLGHSDFGIMRPDGGDDSDYETNRERYLDLLFNTIPRT
jgi:hypothetical protein